MGQRSWSTTAWKAADELARDGITVDYMRGGTDRDTYATAEIQRLGGRIANVEAVAWQSDRSKLIASARLNFLLDRSASEGAAG